MLKYKIYAFILLVSLSAYAQDREVVTLTLDECISTALDRSLLLKRAKNNELIAKSNRFQSLMNFLPSLNAQTNYDFFFGTTFDQNAARQVTETTNQSNPNLNSNWTLFNGLSNQFLKRQRSFEYDAAVEDVNDARITTEANILTAYLNVMLSKVNIQISNQRIELLEAQLDRAVKRESVGVGSMEDVYNFRSQLANERINLQNLSNDFQRNKLQLLQNMLLDPSKAEYEVVEYEVPEASLTVDLEPFDQVLDDCLSANPSLRGARASLSAANYQYKVAKSDRYPTLSVLGVFGSNYSSNGAVNPDKPFRNPETNEPGFNFEPNATFFEQMGYNQFEYVNFRFSIPIFNQFSASNNIQIARINMANAELAVQEALVNITNTVQQVYLDLVAAQNTYTSARDNLEALEQSFVFMEKRYQTGNTDFYTYLESLNNKNRAEIQLINAKYSIIFRKKILDIYRSL
jgi:outer membrane protein